MPPALVQGAAGALAIVFGWASVAKLLRPRRWRAALDGYRLPSPVARSASLGVPGAEAAVAGLVVAGATRSGAALALALLAAFSLAVVRARHLAGDRLPCGCFGRAAVRDYRTMLIRNALLALLAAVVLLAGRDIALGRGLDVPSSGELIPAALLCLGTGLVVYVLRRAMPLLVHRGER